MADTEAAPEKTEEPENESDILKEALERYQRGWDREKDNIDQAYEDLRFRRGRPEDQWPKNTIQERLAEGRPCLTINRIPQFIRQVTGDMRQMRPAIRVVPVDNGADVETAKVIEDVVRHIENRSMARHVYTTAGDSQVAAGMGHWQVTTEYAGDGLNQEIRILGIEDGIAVIWDPDSVLPTRSDAMWCHVPVDISTAAFKEKWPGKRVEAFSGNSLAMSGWVTEQSVRVSQYWVKKPIKKQIAVWPDGTVDDLPDDVDEAAIEWAKGQGARVDERDDYEVCRYLLSCTEILEGPTEWPGKHIPVVPVVGEEVRIGREVYRHGIVRYARDPQRMFNYYASAETEATALQPKAPYIATDANVKKHRDIWDTANVKNHPVLIFDPDPKMPGFEPKRVAPPVLSVALKDGRLAAADDMKAVIGIYDASLGQKSNETSGKAILARQHEGDTGTFVYLDNHSLAVQRTGEIIVDLIPHIYDTARVIRIIGEDGKIGTAELNKPIIQDGVDRVLNDVTVGSYDVTVETGPSYSTKREEARDGMTEFIRAVPGAAAIIGDLYAQAQDWPNAKDIAERLEMVLPPPIKAAMDQKKQGGSGPPMGPDGQPMPDPAQQAQAMQAQMAQQAMQRQAEVENAKAEAEIAVARASVATANAKTETAKVQLEIALADLAAKQQGIHLNAEHAMMDLGSKQQGMAHDAETHAATLVQGMEKHDSTMMQGAESHAAKVERMQATQA